MAPKHAQKHSGGFVIDLTNSSTAASSSDGEMSELESLQAELRSMRDAHLRLQLQHQLKIEELVADLNFSHDQNTEQEDVIRKLELKVDRLNDEHDVKLRQVADKCDGLRDENQLLKQELEDAESRAADAELGLKDAQEDVKMKTEALEAAELHIDQLDKELDDCQGDLCKALGDVAVGLSEHIQLEDTHQDTCTQLTNLYKEEADNAHLVFVKHAQAVKSLRVDVEKWTNRYDHLNGHYKDLMKRHIEKLSAFGVIEETLREKIITNQLLHGHVRDQLDKIKELEKTNVRLQKLNDVDIAKREKYQQIIKDDEQEQKKAFEKEAHEMKRVNVDLNKRTKKMQRDAELLASKTRMLEKQYEDEMKEAEQVNNALQDEKMQLQNKLDQVTTQLTKSKADLETVVQGALERNGALLAKQTDLHDQLDNTVAMLAERLDIVEQDKTVLLDERDQLQQQLNEAAAERQQLLTQLTSIQEDLRHTRSAKKDSKRQRDLELNSYKQETAGLYSEIDRLDKIRIQLWKEVHDYEVNAAAGRHTNQKLKQVISELEAQIAGLQVQLKLADAKVVWWARALADGLGIKQEERETLTEEDLNAACLKVRIFEKEKARLNDRLAEERGLGMRSTSRGRTFAKAYDDGGGNVDEAVRESLSRSGSPTGAQLIVAEVEENAVYADDQEDDEMEWPDSKPLFGRRWSVDIIRWDNRNDIFTKAG